MISSYRLGDLVILNLNENEKNKILMEHPNSIASKYILQTRNNNCYNNIDLITKIVMEHIEQNLNYLPKNITESTVIHLRIGDVVAGNEWHEKLKRPLSLDYIKKLVIKYNINPIYVIGKCFFAETSSTNYEECISKSNEYLHKILEETKAEHFNSGNADIDLCCAVKSKLFIQGKGYFSQLIVEIRKKLNLNNIETNVTNY